MRKLTKHILAVLAVLLFIAGCGETDGVLSQLLWSASCFGLCLIAGHKVEQMDKADSHER